MTAISVKCYDKGAIIGTGWINAPSKLQSANKYHGHKVVYVDEGMQNTLVFLIQEKPIKLALVDKIFIAKS